MSEIELVIKIPEEKYNMIKSKMYCGIYDVDVYKAILNGTPLPKVRADVLNKIKAEIEDKFGSYEFGGYSICEWFEDFDYEENDISEYREVGRISDIIDIIDKHLKEVEE